MTKMFSLESSYHISACRIIILLTVIIIIAANIARFQLLQDMAYVTHLIIITTLSGRYYLINEENDAQIG